MTAGQVIATSMTSFKLRVALIGNGAIARQVAAFCAARPDRLALLGALNGSPDAASVGAHPLVQDAAALLALKPYMVVECAGHAAVAQHGAAILAAGVDLAVISAGSLADDALHARLLAAARQGGAQLRIPAGALAGIDALASAKLAGLQTVRLQTAKPPLSWKDTPAESRFDLAALTEATVIFAGSARDAARLYPRNANVAATVSLAGIGFDRTEVELIADPALSQNRHRLTARGAFGEMALEIAANPVAGNARTSLMAALSVMHMLDRETAAMVI